MYEDLDSGSDGPVSGCEVSESGLAKLDFGFEYANSGILFYGSGISVSEEPDAGSEARIPFPMIIFCGFGFQF